MAQLPDARHQDDGFPGKEHFPGEEAAGKIQSQLRQWPIQLHLISPTAAYYQGRTCFLTADCVGYALGDLPDFLKGKSIAIACSQAG